MSRGFALTAWKYHSGLVNRNVLTPARESSELGRFINQKELQ